MPTIADLEQKLEQLREEYARIKIISQSDPGPIMDKRAIQRQINRTERELEELKSTEKSRILEYKSESKP